MGSFSEKNEHHKHWTMIGPAFAALLFSSLNIVWMPWERVHPVDASLREPIGYAPIWSHRFGSIAGAQIDWRSLASNLTVIWVIAFVAALMLNFGTRRD